jgi:hypothetical protein
MRGTTPHKQAVAAAIGAGVGLGVAWWNRVETSRSARALSQVVAEEQFGRYR